MFISVLAVCLKTLAAGAVAIQDGFIHIANSGWVSVNTEEKKNKHYIQKVKNQKIRSCSTRKPNHINVDNMV